MHDCLTYICDTLVHTLFEPYVIWQNLKCISILRSSWESSDDKNPSLGVCFQYTMFPIWDPWRPLTKHPSEAPFVSLCAQHWEIWSLFETWPFKITGWYCEIQKSWDGTNARAQLGHFQWIFSGHTWWKPGVKKNLHVSSMMDVNFCGSTWSWLWFRWGRADFRYARHVEVDRLNYVVSTIYLIYNSRSIYTGFPFYHPAFPICTNTSCMHACIL